MTAPAGLAEASPETDSPDGSGGGASMAQSYAGVCIRLRKLLSNADAGTKRPSTRTTRIPQALTSWSIERARGCGFSGYWTKPLDVERVLAEIDVVQGLNAHSSVSQ